METKKLSAKQKLAIELAATGTIWIKIAEQVGVTERTLYKWKYIPEFKDELARQRSEYLQHCMDTARADIQSLAPAAVECLMKAMAKGSVRAALAIAAGTGALKPPPAPIPKDDVIEFGEVQIPE